MPQPNRMESREPVINMVGNGVCLGPLDRKLLPLYNLWNNDLQTTRTLASMRPVILEEEILAFDQIMNAKEYLFFTIYEKETLTPIGNTYLSDIDFKNRKAEFNIVIGDHSVRGKGYGTEVTKLVLDYSFQILGLHNIFLRVLEYNKGAIHAYEKAGFKECGRRRQAHFLGGKYWDTIFMDCLSTEFESVLIKDELGL
ncbi:GNAT family protein [Bacillus sp. 31A1R]|uniref:GNAT family protein n=1 Tax=Robertmurraya mangrovi TaxID=3098077 RepID=A0ABU5ITD9_9BACI|nr:GNAT family protein [Bacillus sp. 31A1R]MDZ5470420.1 GNAT family protein [Bacillus sp. 31A1R]